MPSERVLYEFADGNRETRQPAPATEIGDRLTRRGHEWVVVSIADRGEVTVVSLHRAPTDGHRPGARFERDGPAT